jgi:hypothetical protein
VQGKAFWDQICSACSAVKGYEMMAMGLEFISLQGQEIFTNIMFSDIILFNSIQTGSKDHLA